MAQQIHDGVSERSSGPRHRGFLQKPGPSQIPCQTELIENLRYGVSAPVSWADNRWMHWVKCDSRYFGTGDLDVPTSFVENRM